MGNINWYPGHMKKTREMIQSNLKLVDIIIEILDARIPNSSKNPIINEITANKKRIILLNKADLADKRETYEWIRLFEKEGYKAIEIDALTGRGIDKLYKILNEFQAERDEKKRNSRPLRIMILGVPNVGKSSLINRLSGRKSTKTGNKPGITKGKQWITLENGMQLLDTPGILWPKFEEPEVGLNLAFAGSIKDEILEIQDIGLELIGFLADNYPEEFMNRYKLSGLSDDKLANMEALALKRGFILPGKRIDYERTARTVIDEFRAGKIGKITLEKA
ncbi:ribosome biogenesis GTPase YlqF [Alterileibacterium massiliense]|uniref:ribosome biogenesis GTPase YlqF n=1 Tax=Alterileibacterium massiliense TaxID=1870997 RepID=UPI0008DA8E76|nr:ribosome biogenesis GTPase YlqF [Alterileibacterium massiliense]